MCSTRITQVSQFRQSSPCFWKCFVSGDKKNKTEVARKSGHEAVPRKEVNFEGAKVGRAWDVGPFQESGMW